MVATLLDSHWRPSITSASPQIEVLRARLDGWVDKVSNAAVTLEDEAVGVAVQPMVS